MGQQAGNRPEFCARTPACLAQEGHERAGSEREVLISEATQLQSRLREQLSQVRTESGVFLRLMYKNKNQHRRSLYFRHLSEVKRDLGMLSTSGLNSTVENLTKFFHDEGQSGRSFSAVTQCMAKDSLDEKEGLRTLLVVARLLDQIDAPIMASSAHIAGLLGQTFFMPFALTMFSCLARFRVLFIQVLFEVVSAFNLVSALWQSKQKVPVGLCLPPQLECQWEGERLCLIEKNSTSRLGKGNKDVDLVAAPTPIWFVDDRTGVLSDLGRPSTVAGDKSNTRLKTSSSNFDERNRVPDTEEDGADVYRSYPKNVNDQEVFSLEHLKTAHREVDVRDSELVKSRRDMQTATGSGVVHGEKELSENGPDIVAKNGTLKRDDGAAQKKNVAYISVMECHGPYFRRIASKRVTDVLGMQEMEGKAVEVFSTEEETGNGQHGGAKGFSGSSFTRENVGADLKRSVAVISKGCDGRKRQKKNEAEVTPIRNTGVFHSKEDEAKFENREVDDRKDRQSDAKQKTANDLFAMLLEGAR